jgi:hypothetical protein
LKAFRSGHKSLREKHHEGDLESTFSVSGCQPGNFLRGHLGAEPSTGQKAGLFKSRK